MRGDRTDSQSCPAQRFQMVEEKAFRRFEIAPASVQRLEVIADLVIHSGDLAHGFQVEGPMPMPEVEGASQVVARGETRHAHGVRFAVVDIQAKNEEWRGWRCGACEVTSQGEHRPAGDSLAKLVEGSKGEVPGHGLPRRLPDPKTFQAAGGGDTLGIAEKRNRSAVEGLVLEGQQLFPVGGQGVCPS